MKNTTIGKKADRRYADYFKKFSKKRAMAWVDSGVYYGYPKCCIINFCERGYKKTKEQVEIGKNNIGFIPCPSCSKKVVNKEITLKSLIKNRECKKPFGIMA